MSLGQTILKLRREKELSQGDLAKSAGVSREIVGRYERDDALPSIEVAKKIADTLNVTLDYLVGSGEYSKIDKQNLQRLEEIENLPADVKDKMFFFIDTVLRDSKVQLAYK